MVQTLSDHATVLFEIYITSIITENSHLYSIFQAIASQQ